MTAQVLFNCGGDRGGPPGRPTAGLLQRQPGNAGGRHPDRAAPGTHGDRGARVGRRRRRHHRRVRPLDQGFTLAMDDFTWFDGAERILEMASIVKIDLTLVQPDEIPELLERCRKLRRDPAGREGRGQGAARTLQGAGLRILQGYLLSRPQIVQGRGAPPGRLAPGRPAHRRASLGPDARIDTIERSCGQTPRLRPDPQGGQHRELARDATHGAFALRGVDPGRVACRLQAWVTLMLVMGHDTAPERRSPRRWCVPVSRTAGRTGRATVVR